jgi:nucleoid-associated protein YgaU
MDRGARILLASAVLTAGIATALLFRHPSTRVGSSELNTHDPPVLRQKVGPDAAGSPATRPPTARIETAGGRASVAPGSGPVPATLEPMDPGEPPPRLARAYPHADRETAPAYPWDWPASGAEHPQVRTHKIVDGDTLPGLAEEYLGSADRFLEIFEANQDQLTTPDLLPIGVELKIPDSLPAPRQKRAQELVPVPRVGSPGGGGL